MSRIGKCALTLILSHSMSEKHETKNVTVILVLLTTDCLQFTTPNFDDSFGVFAISISNDTGGLCFYMQFLPLKDFSRKRCYWLVAIAKQ